LKGSETSLTSRIVNSAIYSVGSNVLQRTLGLASMLILARLLTPEDYGVVAAALLIVELFNELSRIGINQYILGKSELSDQDLNTAWTLQLGIRVVLALIIVIFSAPLAAFFDFDALRLVLCAAAAVPVIEALQNPGIFLLQRMYSYKAISFIHIMSKLLGVACGIAVALMFRSYWALIVNGAVAAASLMLLSYVIHAHRPRLSLRNIKSQWNFSQWNLARAIVGYSRSKSDNFLVGRLFGMESLGFYSMSKQLATLPQEQLVLPISDIVTSTIGGTDERKSFAHLSLTKLIVTVAGFILPFVLILFSLTDELVLLLLGEQWQKNSDLIRLLAPLSLTYAGCALIETSLVAIGRVKDVFILDVITLLMVLACLAIAIFSNSGIEMFALIRTLAGLLVLIFSYFFIKRFLALDTVSLLLSLLPIAISGGVCWYVLVTLQSFGNESGWSSFWILFVAGGLGMLVYFCTMCALLFGTKRTTDELQVLKNMIGKGADLTKTRLLVALRSK